MANIHEIEKEIIQLQENIEAALNELQTKPRGIMAKYAKLQIKLVDLLIFNLNG